MVDRDAAALERRCLGSRSVRDRGALIRQQLRAGLLSQETVSLAAYLGHPGAGEAIGWGLSEGSDVDRWFEDHGLGERSRKLRSWIVDYRAACRAQVRRYCHMCMPGMPEFYRCASGWSETRVPKSGHIEVWAECLVLWGFPVACQARGMLAEALMPLVSVQGPRRGLIAEFASLMEAAGRYPCAEHEKAITELLSRGHARRGELCLASSTILDLAETARLSDLRYHGVQLARAVRRYLRILAQDEPDQEAGKEELETRIRERLMPEPFDSKTPLGPTLPKVLEAQAKELRDCVLRDPGLTDRLRTLAALGHGPASFVLGCELHSLATWDVCLCRAETLPSRSRSLLAESAALAIQDSDDLEAHRVLSTLAAPPVDLRRGLKALEDSLEDDGRVASPESERRMASARAALFAGYAVLENGPAWAIWEAVDAARRYFRLTRPELTPGQGDEALREALIEVILRRLGLQESSSSFRAMEPRVAMA